MRKANAIKIENNIIFLLLSEKIKTFILLRKYSNSKKSFTKTKKTGDM